MNPRKLDGAVLTLLLSVLAGFVLAVPSTASAAPGTVPCGPTHDHLLTGTPATAPRTVALTFDDGPSPNWTPQLLDILRRNEVRATFFLVGAEVEKYPDLARRIAREGHTIGNHTWSHPYFDQLSRGDQAWQMDATTDVIRRTTGVTPCVFRAPYGQASGTTLQVARERGMSVANWSHNTADYTTPRGRSAQFQRDLIGRATAPWDDHADVLMHDGSNGNYRQNTVDSLQRIIDHYRHHGYYFTDPMGRWSGTTISDHYNRINGEWALGAPVTGEIELPHDRGRATAYQHGGIYWSSSTGAHAIRHAIWERYRQIGYEKGPLGMPVTDETPTPDRRGVYQHFQGGSIYWTAKTGAQEVYGAIRRRWGQLGREHGLGYPTTGELTTSDRSGRYGHFERGSIYWTARTGAHEIRGAIRDRWNRLGAEKGLGYPTTGERSTSGGKGAYQEYQRGAVYWSPGTGAHEVRGAIRGRWNSTGRETGSLGYPTGDERVLSGGTGVLQAFQRGWIYWSEDSGARIVLPGAVRDRWASLGWENGVLGYPVGDQRRLPDGRGQVQSFQRGHVYWTAATGAQAVLNGPIRDRWASLGWEQGVLGYPTAGVVTTSTGSSQEFQRGTIAWTAQGGAQVLRGAVRSAWVQLQREEGVLGYPTSGQNTGEVAGTTWTRFTGGVLYTTPEGPITVLGAFAEAWRAEGGDAGIGRPLSAASIAGDGVTRQAFAHGTLEKGPDGQVRRQVPTTTPEPTPVVPEPAEEVVPGPQTPSAPVDGPATPAPTQEQSAPDEGTPEQGAPTDPARTAAPTQAPAPTQATAPAEASATAEAPATTEGSATTEPPATTGAPAQAEQDRTGTAAQD